MSHHTVKTKDLPWPWLRTAAPVLQWLSPSKNFCIAAIITVALWMIVYCTAHGPAPMPLPDGATALIGVLLGVNALHSGYQAHTDAKVKIAGKAPVEEDGG